MPKFKGKASRSRSPAGPRGGGGGGGGGFCDTTLVPRVEEFARAGGDLGDLDGVVEHLRGCYREYLRKPMLIFRKGVERACEVARKRVAAPASNLESLEAAHLERRGLKMAGSEDDDDDEEESDEEEGEEEGSERSDDDGSDDSDSSLDGQGLSDDDSSEDGAAGGPRKMSVDDVDVDAPGAADTDNDNDGRVMNDNLAKLYSGGGGDGEKPAFAAPHLVAAAAQRALAAEKATKGGTGGPGGPGGSAGGGGGAGSSLGAGGSLGAATANNANNANAGGAFTTPGKDAVGGPGAAGAAGTPSSPPMSAAEAGHIAVMATARAARLKEIEQNKNKRGGGKNNKKGGKNKNNKRKRGGGPEFGEGDFIEDYLPGGKKYRKGGSGNGPGDPFGVGGGDGDGEGAEGTGSITTPSTPRNVRLADLGGIEESLQAIRELILCPLIHPELYGWLGVDPPRGVLLHGPPGCGKTTLAHAIAREAGVPFFSIAAPEIVAGVSGESEQKIRQLFTAAAAAAPAIIFIDEIDAIVPKREGAQRQMESRIVAQLLASMDNLNDGGAGLSAVGGTPGNKVDGGGGGGDGDGWSHDRGAAAEDEYAGGAPPRRGHVTVIGATNRQDSMDAALRRAGRFDREIMLGIPDEAARARILAVQARKLRLAGGLDLAEIAKKTPGYVGADLSALAKEAAALAVARIFKQLSSSDDEGIGAAAGSGSRGTPVYSTLRGGLGLGLAPGQPVDATTGRGAGAIAGGDGGGGGGGGVKAADDGEGGAPAGLLGSGRLADRRPFDASELAGLSITDDDFTKALTRVQPSAQREGFTTTPEVTWEDVGSLTEVREELAFSVVEPIAHPARFQAMGLAVSTGVLLYGPPGCGKTLVAKATANEANANFISIKGPELLNKYVGESERAVRTLFARARAAAPCVLFFDELDSLAPRRGNDSGNQASERVVNQLLTEMDGLEARSATFVVAATNRPDMIDPAMLRPGRLDKLLYVPLPPPDGRASILKTLTRKTPLADGMDVAKIGESGRCNGFSGADLASLVREACVAALKGNLAEATRADSERERSLRLSSGGGKTAEEAAAAAAALLPAPPPPEVTMAHFDEAFVRVQPSVSAADQRRYDELRRKLRRERGSLAPGDVKTTTKTAAAAAAQQNQERGGKPLTTGPGGLLEAGGPAMTEDSGGSAGRIANVGSGKGSGASSGIKSKKPSSRP